MSEVFDFSDVGAFRSGSFLPNPKDSSLFLSPANLVDLYLLPHKRSRVCAPFVVSEEAKQQPSIEVLPDECLFEVFRRLPGGKERSACACVSKHWLMLLSSITRDEVSVPQVNQSKSQEVDEIKADEEESNGYLSRSLEGKKATDVRLAAIAVGTAGRGGLGKLSIRGNASTRGLTNLGLKAISRGSPSLRALSLWNLSSISDEGLSDVANGCRSLEKIDLCNCPSLTDKGLIAIAMNCPNLMSVAVESCSNIGNETLQALGRFCPKLKCVSIKNCPLVGDQGIASLFTSAGHNLTKTKLESLNITDVSLAVIGHYGREMTDLSLVDLQNVNERGFWVMGKGQGLQKLGSLSVTACQGASDLGLGAVGEGCPNLKLFAVRKCLRISDNGVVSFAKVAGSLESLQIEECHMITQRGFFGILANCGEKLKALALANCLGIRDMNFGFLLAPHCDSLRSLTIRNCPGFDDSGLCLLAKICPKLTHVDLSGLESITDAGIVPLVQSSKAGLVKVNLSKCINLSDNAVSAISKLHGETIELLNLDGCRRVTDTSLIEIARNCLSLSELDVSQSGITDYGVTALAAAKQMNLQILSVAGCSLISDKSVPFLMALGKTLVGMNIQHCPGISFGATSNLLDQLWRCDILY
ncbi:EIN3-binding F-box protein 1-like [Salvia splendens]|uniref:EIN3-binding F-box protein 1-like n=1 Tax=Salvia splendens TaxID=180675 RepID=UPI001C2633E9|nr:EIN3-binding F-box protein 1-like [Salvia splendens]